MTGSFIMRDGDGIFYRGFGGYSSEIIKVEGGKDGEDYGGWRLEKNFF